MHWDLLIVGGGPAGCAAALRARQFGLRVAILEKDLTPRKRPGETLHPGVEPLFEQLGVADRILAAGFHRHRGIWIEWEGPRSFQAYGADKRGTWKGFQAERTCLDGLLLQAARESGVVVFQPCRAIRVLKKKDRIIGVETTLGPIKASWIANATGTRSQLASDMASATEYHSPLLLARFGWRNEYRDELQGQPLFQARPRGWDWVAQIDENRLAWVELRLPLSSSNSLPRSATLGANVRWRIVPHCAGKGYFLLGDAAANLDPSSSHGVLRALMSGICAAHLLAKVYDNSLGPDEAISDYRLWLRAQFLHDIASLRRLWKNHPCSIARAAMGNCTPQAFIRHEK